MKKKKLITIFIILIVIVSSINFAFICKVVYKNVFNKTNNYDRRLDEILSDDKEIERKWLINKDKIPYNLNASDINIYEIKQTYISFSPEMRVRDYNNGQAYEFTMKTNMTSDGLIRDEVNVDISKEEYNNLVKKKEGMTIHKTRYQFYDDGQLYAIDIFHDELDGLAYLEIEFANKNESKKFKEPSWVIKDVTSDIKYKNGYLARYGIPGKY